MQELRAWAGAGVLAIAAVVTAGFMVLYPRDGAVVQGSGSAVERLRPGDTLVVTEQVYARLGPDWAETVGSGGEVEVVGPATYLVVQESTFDDDGCGVDVVSRRYDEDGEVVDVVVLGEVSPEAAELLEAMCIDDFQAERARQYEETLALPGAEALGEADGVIEVVIAEDGVPGGDDPEVVGRSTHAFFRAETKEMIGWGVRSELADGSSRVEQMVEIVSEEVREG